MTSPCSFALLLTSAHNRSAFRARHSLPCLNVGTSNAVVLLEPKNLAEKIKTIAARAAKAYGNQDVLEEVKVEKEEKD